MAVSRESRRRLAGALILVACLLVPVAVVGLDMMGGDGGEGTEPGASGGAGEETSGEKGSEAAGKSPARETLEAAMDALGGRGRLEKVRALSIEFEAREGGLGFKKGRIFQELPSRYRQEYLAWDAVMVHGTDGEKAWATLDGVPVPLHESDKELLREQVIKARISLLVGLLDEESFEVLPGPEDESHTWLEVRVLEPGLGTYDLGFDRNTMLLRQVAWETAMHGRRPSVPVTMTLADYREVGGIMVPYLATYRVEGEHFRRTSRVTGVKLADDLDDTLFEAPEPPEKPPVKRRRTRPFRVALLKDWEGEPARAEEKLRSYLEGLGLRRHGLTVRIRGPREGLWDVGVPVAAPREPEAGALGEGGAKEGPELCHVPEVDALTVVVSKAGAERLGEAEARLEREARDRGLVPAGGCRHLVWDEDLVQVQLPVRPR